MPRIITYAIELDVVKAASGPIAEDIAALLDIPEEHVVIQVNRDVFVQDAEVVPSYPFVEVCLFDRGQQKEDEIARILTKRFRAEGCDDIEVYLTKLERRRYFENGEHF